MKVYCVQGLDGWVYAIFASENDAFAHRDAFDKSMQVVERTVFYGQAVHPGYNR